MFTIPENKKMKQNNFMANLPSFKNYFSGNIHDDKIISNQKCFKKLQTK